MDPRTRRNALQRVFNVHPIAKSELDCLRAPWWVLNACTHLFPRNMALGLCPHAIFVSQQCFLRYISHTALAAVLILCVSVTWGRHWWPQVIIYLNVVSLVTLLFTKYFPLGIHLYYSDTLEAIYQYVYTPYHCNSITRDQSKAACPAPGFSLFQFHLAFLHGAPLSFQRLINSIVCGDLSFITAYLDDLLECWTYFSWQQVPHSPVFHYIRYLII